MEINVKDLPGSLAGGGRYDNLIGMFLGSDVPACGFSLGLERILVVMQERGMFPPEVEQASIDVVVAALDEERAGGRDGNRGRAARVPVTFASISIRTSRRRWTGFSSTSISAGRSSSPCLAATKWRRHGDGAKRGDETRRRCPERSGIVHSTSCKRLARGEHARSAVQQRND